MARPLAFHVRLAPLFILLTFNTAARPTAAAESVVVELRSGALAVGEIDARTSSRLLWLRVSRGSAIILRPIEWDRVERATVGSEDLSVDAFQNKALNLRSLPEENDDDRPRLPVPPEPDVRTTPIYSHEIFLAPPTIGAIWADAWLAHWDRDAAADGLVLQLVALDCSGWPAPAEGSLEVELWTNEAGQRRHIGRWTCWLSPADFGPSGARQRLPFQAYQPEFERRLGSHGVVHVRFSSPGNGTFDYSVNDVRIRSPSAVRDQWEQCGQGRFLPTENLGPINRG
jgi:hypothetical protein